MEKAIKLRNMFKVLFVKLAAISTLALAAWLATIPIAGAQTGPELTLTWQAGSFVPNEYPGKAMAVSGTTVKVAATLTDNGRIVDISNIRTRWLVDGKMLKKDVGVQSIDFTADIQKTFNSHAVTFIVEYQGKDISKTIHIPVVRPLTVIRAPLKNGIAAPGKHELRSLFYNWNIGSVNQLVIQWSINGDPVTALPGSTDRVSLEVPKTPVATAIIIANKAANYGNDLETSDATLNLTTQ